MNGFAKLNFEPSQIEAILKILFGILYLGNCEFDKSVYLEGQAPCKVVQDGNWAKVIDLF